MIKLPAKKSQLHTVNRPIFGGVRSCVSNDSKKYEELKNSQELDGCEI